MKCFFIKKVKSKNAQALVEFALCMPLIILILGIMITVGQMTYTKQVLQCAAQTAGRTYIEVIGDNVDDATTIANAKAMAKEIAIAIITTAGYGLDLGEDVDAFYASSPEPLYIDGIQSTKYKIVKVETVGRIHMLFPVYWDGVVVSDSDTGSYMRGSIVMLLEHNYES